MTGGEADDPTETPPEGGGKHRAGLVTLAGRTNVGKSTLLNRLIGQKLAIVSDVPQTTRHRILGVLTLDHAQIAFTDTPGIHRPAHRMNRLMVASALDALRGVDLVLLVADAATGIGPGDRFLAGRLRREGMLERTILVLNKADLVPRQSLLPLIETGCRELGVEEIVPLSALRGDNCDRLIEVVVRRLPEGPPLYPPETLTDQTERRLVAEIVREKILRHTRQELPHETAVAVTEWRERPDGLVEVSAVITCDRESQKAIVIGRRGGLLKTVGSEARAEIESLLGRRVMLRLWVKVRQGWREDAGALRDLGIGRE